LIFTFYGLTNDTCQTHDAEYLRLVERQRVERETLNARQREERQWYVQKKQLEASIQAGRRHNSSQ